MQKITIPIIKVSSNTIYSGKHWTFRDNLKKDYLLLTANYFKKLKPCTSKINLDFKFYFKGKTLDSSNCSFMIKMIEDCLTHYNIIKDDTIKYIGKISVESFKGTEDLCEIVLSEYI